MNNPVQKDVANILRPTHSQPQAGAERQVVDLLDLNLDYGQGHLFGEPRAIKEAVLTEAGPPPNLIRPQFRDTLARRAAFG